MFTNTPTREASLRSDAGMFSSFANSMKNMVDDMDSHADQCEAEGGGADTAAAVPSVGGFFDEFKNFAADVAAGDPSPEEDPAPEGTTTPNESAPTAQPVEAKNKASAADEKAKRMAERKTKREQEKVRRLAARKAKKEADAAKKAGIE